MDRDILTIKDIFKYLLRFKYLIILTVAGSLVATYFYTKNQVKIYKATTSIIIKFRDTQNPVQEMTEYNYSAYQEYDSFFNTEYEIIKSYGLATEVVTNYNLENHPYFEKIKNASKGEVDIAQILQSILSVTPIQNSSKVLLSVETSDPQLSMNLANYYAESYKEYNIKKKTNHLKKSLVWLQERVNEADERVIDAELNLFEFKKQNKVLLTSSEDTRNVTIQKLYSLEEQYNKIRLERIDAEQDYLFFKNIKDLEIVSDQLKDTSYSNLKLTLIGKKNELEVLNEKYKEENPKIISLKSQIENIEQQLKQTLENYRKQVENKYKLIQAKEKELLKLKEDVIQEALKIEQNELKYKQDKRTATTETEVHKILFTELKKSNLKLLLQSNNVEILDYAKKPTTPIRPQLKVNLAIGLFLGFILSFIFILLLLFLDKTVKTREEIEENLGLPFLGYLLKDIKVEKENVSYKELYSINAPRSNFAENCRSITTNMDFINTSEKETKVKSYLVTSPGPVEGKTTIASNLSATISEQGLKTVIIDTDLRKPRLHKVFNYDNKLGVTSFVSGNNTIDSIIQKTELKNLDFISTGPIPPNAIQIIKSPKFTEMFEYLKKNYDRVIFDSPPISAVSDALVISKMVDGVVLVVKFNSTNKHYLIEAKSQFTNINSKIIGVILNQADKSKISYYSYKKYDYYYYGKDEK